MSTALQAISVFLPVLYGAAASLHIAHFGNPASPFGERLRRLAVFSAIALHLVLFAVTWRIHGSFPVDDPWSALSGIAFGLGFLHFATTRFIINPGTGAVVLSIVMGMQLFASAFGSLEEPPVKVQPGAFTLFHSLISMVAASAIGLSGINGGLYLFLFRRMQKRHFDGISRGLIELRDIVFFGSMIAFFLFVNALVLHARREA